MRIVIKTEGRNSRDFKRFKYAKDYVKGNYVESLEINDIQINDRADLNNLIKLLECTKPAFKK
jgi:hypothetical protein